MNTKEKREIVFYDCRDSEHLEHESQYEAIEEYMDVLWPEVGNEHVPNLLSKLPKTIRVTQYVRMPLSMPSVLDDLLERLDEEHADPEGDFTRPTPAMKEAEAAFLDVVRHEYKVWMCEPIGHEDVDVEEWIREEHPEWLEVDDAK
jgi:hypothetical protein